MLQNNRYLVYFSAQKLRSRNFLTNFMSGHRPYHNWTPPAGKYHLKLFDISPHLPPAFMLCLIRQQEGKVSAVIASRKSPAKRACMPRDNMLPAGERREKEEEKLKRKRKRAYKNLIVLLRRKRRKAKTQKGETRWGHLSPTRIPYIITKYKNLSR